MGTQGEFVADDEQVRGQSSPRWFRTLSRDTAPAAHRASGPCPAPAPRPPSALQTSLFLSPLPRQTPCTESSLGCCELGMRPDGSWAAWASPRSSAPAAGGGPCPSASVPADFPGGLSIGEPPTKSPPWEKALVGKITAMSVIEKRLLLEAIRQCIQEQNQVGPRGPSPHCSLLFQGPQGAPTSLCSP